MTTAVMTRVGNSVGVIIPKELRGVGFQQRSRLNIDKHGNSLIITPEDELMTLQSLVRNYDGSKPEFIDPGASMGREAW